MSILVRSTVSERNTPLLVDGSNQLSVKDSVAQTSLSNIDTALGGTIAVSASALPLPSGASTAALQTSGNSSLSSINTALAGSLDVSDSAAQTKLTTIASTLSGTLTTSSGVVRTNSTLTNAAVVAASAYTSSVDANAARKIAVYGSSSLNSQQLRVFISDDDTNYYEDVSNAVYSNGNNGDYYKVIETVARYIKFQYQSGATETTKYTLFA